MCGPSKLALCFDVVALEHREPYAVVGTDPLPKEMQVPALNYKDDKTFVEYLTMSFVGELSAIGLMRKYGHEFEFDGYGAGSREIFKDVFLKQMRTPDLKCLRCSQRLEVRAKSRLQIAMSDSPQRPFDRELAQEDWVGFVRVALEKPGLDRFDPANYSKPMEIYVIEVAELSATKEIATLSKLKAAGKGSEKYLVWPTLLANCDGILTGVKYDPSRLEVTRLGGKIAVLTPPSGAYPYNGIRKGDAVRANETLICGIARTIPLKTLMCKAITVSNG